MLTAEAATIRARLMVELRRIGYRPYVVCREGAILVADESSDREAIVTMDAVEMLRDLPDGAGRECFWPFLKGAGVEFCQ